MDTFELDVFGRAMDDDETIHTIRVDLERDLARSVSPEAVGAALTHLAELGYIDAFVFDRAAINYRKVAIGAHPVTDLSFLVSPRGRTEYARVA